MNLETLAPPPAPPLTPAFETAGSAIAAAASVPDLVAVQAALRPQAIAVADRRRRLPYQGLMREAHRLAHHLATEVFAPGDVIGLLLEPSCELASSLLGVWRAGGVALPMDPALPLARLQLLVQDAGCRIVIGLSSHAETLQALGVRPVYLDACARWIRRQPHTAPVVPPQHLACLLYTSGSTGRPKGVALPHAALVHKLSVPGVWGALDAEVHAAWHGSPSFDASLAQLLLPLVHGGRVRAFDSQERLQPQRLWTLLQRLRVNVLDCTPSWLHTMLEAAPPLPALRRIVVGGEILTPAVARRVCERFPQALLVNAYGPTEACIDATSHALQASDLVSASVPIGRPLPGYRIELLGPDLRAVPEGEAGEIAIGGVGLADGYWRQPVATAERFIDDPTRVGQRLYRSGDLGRRRPDGTLEFLGRLDQQAKVRGQRIELGEIEMALARQPGVQAAAVRLWPAEEGQRAVLAAYLVLDEGAPLAPVQAGLRRQLPSAMHPGTWTVLTELPLLPTGKLDRVRLPPPPHDAAPTPLPGDKLQAGLLTLWRAVLGAGCGLHDNFFDAGGDSLAAVELIEALSQQHGVTLTLATLMAHPTVADLALALSSGLETRSGGRVLRLGGGESRATQTMFLLPPASGVGFVYAGLARRLGAATACHALQVVDLGGTPGSHAMQPLACRFADDIQAVQPEGVLTLAGYSAGGAIAHALTAELLRRGRRVGQLWLLDAYEAGAPGPASERQALLRAYRGDMLWDAFGLRGAAADELLAASDRLLALDLARADAEQRAADDPRARRALAAVRNALPPGTALEVFLLLLEGVVNTGFAYAGYEPAPLQGFDGQAWLVQPEGDADDLRAARAATWRRLIGLPLQVCAVPGEHSSLLQRAASVDAIAALMGEARPQP